MRLFVESLKRLYAENKVSLAKLEALKEEEKITQEELDYITA